MPCSARAGAQAALPDTACPAGSACPASAPAPGKRTPGEGEGWLATAQGEQGTQAPACLTPDQGHS